MAKLPILKIIWAENDPRNHGNHLHVEGDPAFTGTPPLKNPGLSPSCQIIMDALIQEYGPVNYIDTDSPGWSSMGWYNRRYIAGTTIWTQHSWSNAIDIGPYYGVAEQERFYKFLKGEIVTLPDQVKIPLEWWAKDVFAEMIDKGYYTEEKDLDKVRESYEFQQITVTQWRTIHGEVGSTAVDKEARQQAATANAKADNNAARLNKYNLK